jgi:phosphotransferase system enzyme I (PtsI)
MTTEPKFVSGEIVVTGKGVAPGIAIGPVYVYSRAHLHVDEETIQPDEVAAQLKSLRRALKQSGRDLEKIISITREKMGDDSAAIFEAQALMLHDESLVGEVRHLVENQFFKADYAVRHVMDEHRRRIDASESEYLRERSHDLADVEERLIRHLRREKFLSAIDPDRIVIAENLTAADIVLFSRREILGCAMDFGGTTSHVSIMARSLGLPAVVGTHSVSDVAESGMMAVVDGFRGHVILNPTEETIRQYELRRDRYARLVLETSHLVSLAAETIDQRRITIRANLEFKSELSLLAEYGAEGIGLFRTELLFLMEGRIDIDEEKQFNIYRVINEQVGDAPTTIRLLDLGGDKMLPMAHREHNPFLGWRGIRVLLDRPEILRTHLRAILRASNFGPLRILVPMVSTLDEIRRVKMIVREEMDALRLRGQQFDEAIKIGAMIEVPSAALTADQFAAEVDFLSIGTNDLTQYVLAVDRGNDLVSDLYQELHPAVLRLIKHISEAGRRHGIPVSICGEVASDTRIVPLLVGLGIDELSVAPVYVPHVKRIIRAIEYSDVSRLAESALNAGDALEVGILLDDWLASHPYDLLHFIEADVSSDAIP